MRFAGFGPRDRMGNMDCCGSGCNRGCSKTDSPIEPLIIPKSFVKEYLDALTPPKPKWFDVLFKTKRWKNYKHYEKHLVKEINNMYDRLFESENQ